MKNAMRRALLATTATMAIVGANGTAHADQALTLTPDKGINVVGDSTTSAPGFSSGSWQAAGNGTKSEFYINMASLFGPTENNVTIGDIKSISYWTNKAGDGGAPDWTLDIYTNKTGTGDTGSFYHTRLNAEPYFTQTTVASNTWHQWSTDGPNALTFYDQPRDGNYGTYNDPTLAGIQASSRNYSAETIKYLSLQTGSNIANSFVGLVDGLTVTLNDNAVATINFEAAVATPEPSTIALACTALPVGLILAWRRRKAKLAA